MPVKASDLDIYQGDDWAATVTVLNPDMTAADLTGYTAQAQIRTGPADQITTIAAEIGTAVVLPNRVSLFLTHAQTLTLTGFNYQWDLQLTSATGQVTTVLAGGVNVTRETTRPLAAAAEWRR
jgi:hypothetical protein